MKNSKLKILTGLMLVTMTFSMKNVYSSKFSEYEKQLEQIKKEESKNIKELTGVQRALSQYNFEIVSLDMKMNEANKEIIDLQSKIDEANETIKKHETSLENTSKLYESAQKEYLEKLRIVYENGIPNIIEMLVTSNGLTDFIRKMNVYTSVLEYYQNKSGNIKSQKEYIDYIKKDKESKKLQIEQLKKSIEKNTVELSDAIEDKKKSVEELEKSQQSLQATVDAFTEKKIQAAKMVDDEIQRIVNEAIKKAQSGTASTFTGGQFAWPVDNYNVITTRFGTIYNLVRPEGSAHTGCDVAGAGILGKPIRAIESGTVTTSKYGNYGYGNYVIIDHGKCTTDDSNYISLYAHATTLAVEVGQKVQKGDVIAYVGSTGNSTGPHLHLEVRINGKITDPLAFYPAMTFQYPYG